MSWEFANELNTLASEAASISNEDNPDAQFFLWLQAQEFSLLGGGLFPQGIGADTFNNLKGAFLREASRNPIPKTIDPRGSNDAQFFAYLEASNVAMLDLDGLTFETARKLYVNDPRYTPIVAAHTTKKSAGRWTDEMICQAMDIQQDELEILAAYGDPAYGEPKLDEVLADSDGKIGFDDVMYLTRKKAVRDRQIAKK